MSNYLKSRTKKYVSNEILNWPAYFRFNAFKCMDKRLEKFYLQGAVSEETPLSEIEFVALDFETTGLDANENSIISIGLVPFTLNKIRCKDSKHWYIRPQDKLEENTVVIHGITHSDLSDAPTLNAVLDDFLSELAGKVVVVHYRNIERQFLDKNLQDLIGEGIMFPVIDTMQIEADIRESEKWSIKNFFKRSSSISLRLANSRERYNLPTYTAHHALVDAIATAELFQAQVQYHFSPETSIKKLWL